MRIFIIVIFFLYLWIEFLNLGISVSGKKVLFYVDIILRKPPVKSVL